MAYTQINMWWNIDYSFWSGNSFAQLTMSPLIFWGSNFLQLESLPYNAWVRILYWSNFDVLHQMVVEGFSVTVTSHLQILVSPSLFWVSNAFITFFTSMEEGVRWETWTMLATCSYPRRSHKGKQSKIRQNSNPLTQPPLPPYLCVREQKIARVNFVTHVWTNAHMACMMNGTPSSMVGWRIRLEILPIIGLTDSGFQSIYFMKNLRWRMKWVIMIVVQKTVTMTVTVRVMSTVEKTVTVTMTAVYEIDVYSECDQCGDE